MNLDALFKIHTDLPREGPGSDAATADALSRIPGLPAAPRVLDVGCGPGRQTLVLAQSLTATVMAVDIHMPYLALLDAAANESGNANLVRPIRADMARLPCVRRSLDLIWSEGAVYVLGLREGLRAWRELLAPGGIMVVSEVVWLMDDPPQEAAAFWGQEYPQITTVFGAIAIARDEGLHVFDHLVLPPEAWWEEYYAPLERRLAALRPLAALDPELAAEIAAHEREIDVHRRFGDSYSYVFLLMRRY